MDNLIFLGDITSTHGIHGELKIKSNFELKNIVFKPNFKIYIDNEVFTITSYRKHKQFDMITINNIRDINEVYKYVKKSVYINRGDLNLKNDEYLLSDLIGYEIIDNNDNIGKVAKIEKNNSILLYIKGQKNFYIPFVNEYIIKVAQTEKRIYTKDVRNLIL